MARTLRLNIKISDEMSETLIFWSQKMGVSKSQLAGIALQAGMKHVLRAVSPEDSIDPELLAKIMKIYEVQDNLETLEKNEKTL